MSPISKRAYQLELLKLRILEVQKVIDGTIGNHSPTPLVIAMKAQVILIKNYIDEIKNMWSAYLTLASDTNIFITNTHLEISTESVNSYIASMLLLANNIPTINNSTTTRVLDLLKLISGVINGRFDGYSNIVKSLNSLIQIVEEIDNPPISRSRSSRSSSSSRSSRNSRSSRSSRNSSPLTSHYTPPPSPLPLQPQNRLVPPLLQRQNAEIFRLPHLEDIPPPLTRLSSHELADARGKKYRKIKTKKRRIKSTHRKPLTTNNSRKHRKTKIKKNN